MRLRASTLLLIIGLFAGQTSVSGSTVPQLIPYSGSLTGPNGHPLPTGDYTLTFKIYSHSTDTNVRPVWGPQIFDGETWRGHGDKVPVVKGFFNVILGPVDIHDKPIARAFRSSDRFIEVTLEGNAPNLPRHQVLSTPFALSSPGETPVGGIIMYSGRESELPKNWRVCDGYQVIDPESPFNGMQVPDLRGLFIRGAENDGEIRNIQGYHFTSPHLHKYSSHVTSSRRVWGASYYPSVTRDIDFWGIADVTVHHTAGILAYNKDDETSHGHTVSISGTTEYGTRYDNRPRHMAVHYIIRIK